jgi:hypothetical protein
MFIALAIATLYILGLWGCYEVVARFPLDVREMFELKKPSQNTICHSLARRRMNLHYRNGATFL